MPSTGAERRGLLVRLLWFFGYWAASVLALAAVALLIRLAIKS
jgi:hypothetical protein